jgi:hypothetical protein
LNDAVTVYTLREVFVRSANDYTFNPVVLGSQRGGRNNSYVPSIR